MSTPPPEVDPNHDSVNARLIDAARKEVEALPGATRAEADSTVLPDAIEGYLVLHQIHRGGQGVVYHAIEQATQHLFALGQDTEDL